MKCEYCGQEFESTKKNQRYCSRKCSMKDYYLRRKQHSLRVVKCGCCGAEFETRNLNQKYCSEKCQIKAKNEQRKKYLKTGELPTTWEPARRVCLQCGREFVESFRGDKFCSDECCWEYYPLEIKYALVKTFSDMIRDKTTIQRVLGDKWQ